MTHSLNDCYWLSYKAIILRKAALREAIYSLIQRVNFNTVCSGKALGAHPTSRAYASRTIIDCGA